MALDVAGEAFAAVNVAVVKPKAVTGPAMAFVRASTVIGWPFLITVGSLMIESRMAWDEAAGGGG